MPPRTKNANSLVKPVSPQLQPVVEIPEPGFPLPSLASLTNISDARLAANRANAQHSTGPITEIGRATSAQNHTIHGLARHNGTFKLLASEDPAGFEALKHSLAEEHLPTTETESILVSTMAESHWLSNRAQNLQATCFDETTGQIADPKLFSLYLRYQTTHTRAFHKSLNDLVKLRAERRKAEHGFEAQDIKNEQHEMKKQAHYWDLLKKDAEACYRVGQNVAHATKQGRGKPWLRSAIQCRTSQTRSAKRLLARCRLGCRLTKIVIHSLAKAVLRP